MSGALLSTSKSKLLLCNEKDTSVYKGFFPIVSQVKIVAITWNSAISNIPKQNFQTCFQNIKVIMY